MNFDIDAETIMQGIFSSLDEAEADYSEEVAQRVINQVRAAMPGLVELSVMSAEDSWRGLAAAAGGWGSKYAKAIKSKFSGASGEVYLDEQVLDAGSGKPNFMFAMMMEKGVKTWSIKAALLASDCAKVGADGVKYITVPFPVATPRKSGQGTPQSYFGGREMSAELHKLVKAGGKAGPGATVPVTTVSGTKNVSVSGLSQYNTRQRHSQYGFFRRVSEKSNGWQYPNVPPEPVFNSVIDYVDRRIYQIVEEFCKEVVKDNLK